MRLGNKQRLFARLVARLLDKAHELGFEVSIGDVFRAPQAHGDYGVQGPYGRAKSNHKLKLAIDLNLFKNGKYIRSTKGHKELGVWWEEQNELCRWGGNF